jgi:hypothetical protein
MRVNDPEYLIKAGDFPGSQEYSDLLENVLSAINKVVWPPGSNSFTLFPGAKKNARLGTPDTLNGVTPIKNACMAHLVACGWSLEVPLT